MKALYSNETFSKKVPADSLVALAAKRFPRGGILKFCTLSGQALLLMLFLNACAAVPSFGPSARDVVAGAEDAVSPDSYVMVPLDATALTRINRFQPLSFPREFMATFDEVDAMMIGVGDRLNVNIWEPSQDGVFATAEKKQTSLQTVVDVDGKVYIPYVGRIPAAGLQVEELRQAIEEGLAGKAVEPQVQVLVEQNIANSIVVVGDVAQPGQFPIPIRGLRLLEAIALAGGPREATYETVATVTRGESSNTARLEEVVNVPANNILLAPGDNVLLIHKPRTYSAFGAVQNSGLASFKTETVSLSEALAQVGGLRDLRVNPGGVFLFRFEDQDLAQKLVETGEGSGVVDSFTANTTPVVYQLNFRNPQAFFLAQSFNMQDKDVIYVANHPTAEFGKFLTLIVSPLLGVARTTSALPE